MIKKDKDKKYIRLHISMEPKLFVKLDKLIIKSGQTKSEIIRSALRNYLRKIK